jgi:hypothetical protein
LRELRADIQAVTDDRSKPWFCANAHWYTHQGRPGFNRRLIELVGWESTHHDHMLHTSDAYDVAYKTLYNLLLDCRGECPCVMLLKAAGFSAT